MHAHTYKKRIDALQHMLHSLSCDGLLVEDPTNLYYLTGIELSSGKLVITSKQSFLIVDGRYFESCQKKSPCKVLPLEKNPVKEWIPANHIKKLAFETETTSYQNFLQLKKCLEEMGKGEWSYTCALVPVESPVLKMRLIKDEEEIAILSDAARLAYEGYLYVVSQLEEGVSEEELAMELEIFWKRRGGRKLAFDPIIAFAENSSMPHYRAGSKRLELGMNVLIDIGVTWNHYQSDMTRVVFFGEPAPKIKEIYTIVDEAKEKALALCKPGATIGELDKAARDYITSKGYGSNFTHSLGHGIGLETHEPPRIRATNEYAGLKLKPGMAITIEPGIYLPDLGGVRLEDTIVITKDGYKNLTNF